MHYRNRKLLSTTVYFDKELIAFLKDMANKTRRSRADIIRCAVFAYLQQAGYVLSDKITMELKT